MLIANHCGLRKVQRVKPARLQVKTFLSAGQTNAPANYSADYRRALIVMGDLPPVKRATPRLFPWLERARTRLEREVQPQHLRRRTVVGAVIPKRRANSWKKIWESLIQWGDFLANENRIDRDPGTLHL